MSNEAIPGPWPVAQIASTDQAQPALSDADRDQAQADAAAAAGRPGDPNRRFVQYVTPRNAASSYVDEHGIRRKIVTRPSNPHAHALRPNTGSYASKIGVSSTKAQIRPETWAQLGIHATHTLVWDFSNGWRIPASRLTDEQLDYLLLNDPRFELVDGRGNKVDS